MPDLAKIAYDAYGESRSWTTANGDQMPPWEHQRPEFREAWIAAAKAVAEVLRPQPSWMGLSAEEAADIAKEAGLNLSDVPALLILANDDPERARALAQKFG